MDVRGQVDGAGARNRTRDLRFTKPLLYQLSYTGLREIIARAPASEFARIRRRAGTIVADNHGSLRRLRPMFTCRA